MELVKNIVGIYLFQKESYFKLRDEYNLPVLYTALYLFLCIFTSYYFPISTVKMTYWWSYLISPLVSLFYIYLLADLVYSYGKGEAVVPTTETLFSLFVLLNFPLIIISVIFSLLIKNFVSLVPQSYTLLLLNTLISFALYFSWYLFGIKTLFDISWKKSLKLGLKALVTYIPLVMFISLVLFFLFSAMGLIQRGQTYIPFIR